MLHDLEYFKTKLGHIDGCIDTSDYLIGIVKSKQVKSASPPPSETKEDDKEEAVDVDKGNEADDGAEEEGDADAETT